jgi:hypothetical protein
VNSRPDGRPILTAPKISALAQALLKACAGLNGGDALLFEYLTRQALGCFGVAAALNQDVEYGPVLVDGPPQPMLLAAVADDDLVEAPFIAGCRKKPADLVRKALAD